MSHTSKMHNSSSPPLLKCQEDAAPHQTAANSFTNKYTRKQHHWRTKTNLNAPLQLWSQVGECRQSPEGREGSFPGTFRAGIWLLSVLGAEGSVLCSRTGGSENHWQVQTRIFQQMPVKEPCKKWHWFYPHAAPISGRAFVRSIFSCYIMYLANSQVEVCQFGAQRGSG